jgi:hypothetical protein
VSTRKQLLLAGSLVAFSVAVTLAEKLGAVAGTSAERAIQVAIGLIVVYFANLAPKTFEPACVGCDPARVQALQRFSARTLFLGGLGYVVSWLVVPFEHAATVSITILGTCVLLVLARYLWTIRTRRQRSAEL